MKIKHCPFCGGHAYIEEGADKVAPFARVYYTRVCCETCGASSRKYYRRETVPQEIIEDDPHELYVVSQWNTRTGSSENLPPYRGNGEEVNT